MFKNSPVWVFDEKNNKLTFNTSQDIIETYNNLYETIFENINLSSDTPQGQLISSDAQRDMAIINSIEELANYHFMGGNGVMLDMWAWNTFRATRKEAINGYVYIDITGTPNSIINAGFTISDGTLQYELNNDIVIANTGSINTIFYAKINTTDISKANTITQIVTPNLNVERINNASDSVSGIPKESDTTFYNRCIYFGSLYPNGSYKSIIANIAQLQGVSKVAGYENYKNSNVTYKGVNFEPHSIGLVILGGDKQDIAKTFMKVKPAGTDMMGDTDITLETDNGQLIVYKYFTPKNVYLKFDITIKNDITSPKNYKEQIINALNNYITTLSIGAYITQPEIAKAIESYVVGFIITDIKLSKKDNTLSYSPIDLNFNEIASLNKEDITIGSI